MLQALPETQVICVHGYHSPLLGCVCHYGWAGPRCDRFTLPSCRTKANKEAGTKANKEAICTKKRPLSCACVEECFANGAFMGQVWPFCFRRTAHNLSDAIRRDEIQTGKAELFHWQRRGRHSRSLLFRHVEQGETRRDPGRWPVELESSCFGGLRRGSTGLWLATDASCSGRGRCIHGSCACDVGFFGPACAFRTGDERAAVVDRRRLRVYVYELPPIVLARRSWASDHDAQQLFMTLQRTVQMVLEDGELVTSVPERADLFLVPAVGTNMESMDGWV